ncbi:MAG: PIN domain-containing protein, partial [Cyanobacteriota bacterium]|nr:PIN domain-containing protein [Cyanobacteriota bacterium]
MRKTFVLDTNVLLHDPEALRRFEDNLVVIPIEVVEEIDRFKRDPSEKGRNARAVSRLLDEHRVRGNLSDGVAIEGTTGGQLKVVFCRSETLAQLPPELKAGNGDNNILAVALEQRLGEVMGSQAPVVLVTKDTNLRIKADAVGLIAQDYTTDKVAIADLYAGICELWLSADLMDQSRHGNGLPLDAVPSGADGLPQLQANEGVTLIDQAQPAHTMLARYNAAS